MVQKHVSFPAGATAYAVTPSRVSLYLRLMQGAMGFMLSP